jgi:hypothetical protein
MAKERIVNTRIYDDAWVVKLDPLEKFVFLYLLTNSATNISGIYEIGLKRIAADTGLDVDVIKTFLERFHEADKLKYIDGWIAIKNFIRYQNVGNPKIYAGIKAELKNAPEDLKLYILQYYDEELNPYDSLSHLNTNFNPNLNSNLTCEQAPIDEESKLLTQHLYDSIVKNTNPATWQTKPPCLESWYTDIERMHRLDGLPYDAIKKVIDFATTDSFWSLNILSASKLRKQYDRLEAETRKKRKGYDPNSQQQKDALKRILEA